MQDRTYLALEATRRIRESPAMAQLSPRERDTLAHDLRRIDAVLGGDGPDEVDPYAAALATPADLQRDLDGRGRGGAPTSNQSSQPTPAPSSGPSRAVDRIGQQTAQALDAIDFPNFIAGLVTGTFDAIVRSTSEQMREYAALVASLSQSVDEFSRDNVSDNQVRDSLAESYPADLRVKLPDPGSGGSPRLAPQEKSEGSSPAWLDKYGLAGNPLDEALAEGALLRAGRRELAEQRMQQLANMVLMGVSRVVVNQGNIKARLNFHAKAVDSTQVALQAMNAGQKAGIAARRTQLSQGATTMVSTVSANVQAESQIRADLMGEVNIEFKTETFPLERFADSPAIQLINRHARWTAPPEQAAAASNNANAAPAVESGPATNAAPASSGEGQEGA